MPDFRILGPLEVAGDDGSLLALGGTRQRSVLAALLLRAGEVVSTDYLIDVLWGDVSPRSATKSLHNAVSELRKVIGSDLLLTRAPGYLLAVDAGQTDLGRFERLMVEARGLPPDDRAAAIRAALDLWRGAPLADLTFERFAAAEVHRLEELRLAAQEEWFDAELAAGRGAHLVAELEAATQLQPLRERPHGQLMLALYEAGRQADALNVYQAARRRLVGELGIEPGPQLQEVHARILRQEVARPRVTAAAGDDDDHYQEVAASILAGTVVPVLGTDVASIAERLALRFRYPDNEVQELTRVAQYVALTKGAGPLHDELRAMLGSGAASTKVHRFFAALPRLLRERGAPYQLLVTTSYDLALEQALLDAGETFDVVAYVASGRDRGRFCHLGPDGSTHVIDEPNTYATELSLERRTVILKLHGGIDPTSSREHESFVVTEDDYIDYLVSSDVGSSVPIALTAALRHSHYLFLGYGMREWNLRLVLGRIWGGSAIAYRSWSVLPAPRPLERQFWRARDIDLVELSSSDYVDALSRYIGLRAEALA